MTNYVLTGAPGAGKTAILRMLEAAGHLVVEEAATDVIALEQALGQPEPWIPERFVDKILTLQRRRERAASGSPADVVFFDRSQVCTLALCRFLGQPVTAQLAAEVDRVVRSRVYAPTVFFVRTIGFVAATSARRISFADSLAFEEVHERCYTELGFWLVDVPAASLAERFEVISRELAR